MYQKMLKSLVVRNNHHLPECDRKQTVIPYRLYRKQQVQGEHSRRGLLNLQKVIPNEGSRQEPSEREGVFLGGGVMC